MDIVLIKQSKCKAKYKINGTIVLIWTITGGQIATSLENYCQTKRWNQIPADKSAWDSTELSWIDDQSGFENWLKSVVIIQTELDKRPHIVYFEAFKTTDNEILIVEVKLNSYISITADLITPVLESDALEIDDFDTSLYYNEIEFNGNTYLFESIACGCLHDSIKQLKTDKFNELIDLHLKDDKESFYQAVSIVQNFSGIDLDDKIEEITTEILST